MCKQAVRVILMPNVSLPSSSEDLAAQISQMSSEINHLNSEIASIKLDYMFQLSDLKMENNNLKSENKNLTIQIKQLKKQVNAIPQIYRIQIDALKYRLIKAQMKRKTEQKRSKNPLRIRRIFSDEDKHE
ncbi:unnamed protein product [Rotaria socialis]|uniref:Uncharacterized protein n=2 Tax=Rotaria socialis TaxID=392032 RepID=A0A818EA47_9BILA|nr:unnamed protein product [Rotaria socialis]